MLTHFDRLPGFLKVAVFVVGFVLICWIAVEMGRGMAGDTPKGDCEFLWKDDPVYIEHCT